MRKNYGYIPLPVEPAVRKEWSVKRKCFTAALAGYALACAITAYGTLFKGYEPIVAFDWWWLWIFS